MTPLRQRFLEDMRIRNYSERTIEAYVAAVARFAKHFGKSPQLLGPEETRAYQVHLLAQQTSWSQFNQIVSGLRLLYRITLGRPEVVAWIPMAKSHAPSPPCSAKRKSRNCWPPLPKGKTVSCCKPPTLAACA